VRQASGSEAHDLLAEDRLLWEFWLNHGLEPEPLAERIAGLPSAPNGDYMALNALYGGFEEPLLRSLEASGNSTARGEVARVVAALTGRIDVTSPEGSLLALLSLWPAAGSETARKAAEAAGSVERWPAFVRAAGRTNLVAAVAAGIRSASISEALPPPWGAVLSRGAEGVRQRSLRILPLAHEMTAALAERGIGCVLLKESALIGEEYPEPGQRAMGDVDILVAAKDLPAVSELMAARGHRPFEGIWSADWYRDHHHHAAPLVSDAEATKVEPHVGIWIPGEWQGSLAEEIMKSARPHRAFRALRPDATFMCFHLLVDLHGGASIGKLGQMADLMRFLAAEGREVDGRRLRSLAERAECLPWLEDSVRLVAAVHGRELLEARAPALAASGQGAPGTLARRLRLRIETKNLFGFEPRASALSVASIKLVHKSLMHPGGSFAAAASFTRTLLAGGSGGAGAGHIARKGRGSAARRLGRLAMFPFRAAARSLRARREKG
jgi:hypothetical protein